MAKPAAGSELSAVFLRPIRVKSATKAWSATRPSISRSVLRPGTMDILGLWIKTTEGAKFWLKVMNDLKARGSRSPDRRRRRPEGLSGGDRGGLSQAAVQTCIVHLIRNSLDFVSCKDRKPVVAELLRYRAADARPAARLWRPSRGRPDGLRNTRRSARSGGGQMEQVHRSSPSLQPSGKSSTRRMRLRP